jgi:hypothetical protein
MSRNEHFPPRNNGNHSVVYSTEFFEKKFRCQPLGGVISVGRDAVNSKARRKTKNFCPNYVQEFGLWNRLIPFPDPESLDQDRDGALVSPSVPDHYLT